MNVLTSQPVLCDDTLILRAPINGDAAARQALGLSAETARMFGAAHNPNAPYTIEMANNWVAKFDLGPNRFCIEHDGRLIGWIWLNGHSVTDRSATLVIGIMDETCLGQGLGTRAMTLLLDHAFGTLNMHRIGVPVLAYNARAIAAYTKLGFVREGVLRDSAWVDGAWHGDIMMGLLSSEWRP